MQQHSSGAVQKLIASRNTAMMRILGRNMVSVTEVAKREGITVQRVRKLLKSDRIPGAIKTYNGWCLIPDEWKYKRKRGGRKKIT